MWCQKVDVFFFSKLNNCVFLPPEMKRIANIFVSFTVLILLLFGTGGVSLMKCSCSGKVSIVLPTDGRCCPQEGSCMAVKVWKVSDAAPTLQKTVFENDVVVSHPIAILPTFFSQGRTANCSLWPMASVDSRPPGRTCTSAKVLRV